MNGILSPCASELSELSIDSRPDTLNALNTSEILSLVQESYATLPMPVCKSESVALDEEELYTSFEQAINERLRSRYTSYASSHTRLATSTGSYRSMQTSVHTRKYAPRTRANHAASTRAIARRHNWQSTTLLILFGLLCLLAGFDVMGLLFLTLR